MLLPKKRGEKNIFIKYRSTEANYGVYCNMYKSYPMKTCGQEKTMIKNAEF